MVLASGVVGVFLDVVRVSFLTEAVIIRGFDQCLRAAPVEAAEFWLTGLLVITPPGECNEHCTLACPLNELNLGSVHCTCRTQRGRAIFACSYSRL